MIIYTKRCLACTDKPTWKMLKSFAAEHNLTIEERRVGLKQVWAKEAAEIGIELPFAAYNGKAVNFNELETLL
jgi:hypothetical protein